VTTGLLAGYLLFVIGCAALWHPAVSSRLDRSPWWVGVVFPGGGLAVLALLAAEFQSGPAPGRVVGTSAVLAVLAAVLGGGPVTLAVLRGAERSGFPGLTDVPGISRKTGVELRPDRLGPSGEVLRGGAWIGILERAAVAVCLLTGEVGAVAVVVAVKGLARYPELRVPGASERFIIGTFASLLWSAGAAGVAVLFW